MSKWIDERTWNISMYICYVLGFIVLSGAGYNYTMEFVGDTSSTMKMVILVCVCLTVALIMFLAFSIFVTPFSELLFRLRKRFQREEEPEAPVAIEDDGEYQSSDGENQLSQTAVPEENRTEETNEQEKEGQPEKDKEVPTYDEKDKLRSQFMSRYVVDGYKNKRIYDTIDQALNERKEGAFAAKVIIAAANHLKWLSSMPSGKVMAEFFGEEAIHSVSSFDSGKTTFKNASKEELSGIINSLESKLMVLEQEKIAAAKEEKAKKEQK